MVWQRFAKSPRVACAGSIPVASAILGPVAQRIGERDSAKVEVARSNRARSTNLKSVLRSGRTGRARVSETRLRRFESYLRSQFE